MKQYILIENFKDAKVAEFKISSSEDEYIRFKKFDLQSIIPRKLYEKLVKNSLYESLITGFNTNDSSCGIHRLVMCLYDNCIKNKVHHINKKCGINNICNLINGEKPWHDKVHREMTVEQGKIESFKKQNALKKKIFKSKRFTVANNEILVRKILELRGINNEN